MQSYNEDRVFGPPWCLTGDLISDKNDTTLSDSSKAESSCGIMVYGQPLPKAPRVAEEGGDPYSHPGVAFASSSHWGMM